MSGCGGRVRLPKRMILGGSLLMMVLFYYAALPEPSMYSGGDGPGHRGPLADDTEIVMNVGNGQRISHGSWVEAKGETIGKSSKQRNYNFQDSRADAGSCGLVSNDNSDSGSCAPASDKRHKEPENNRFSIATEENDVSTSEMPKKNTLAVNVAWTTAKKQESIQEDDQGSKKEDGFMVETEEERVDREEKETIAATIEAEIEREEAEFREMNKDEDDSDNGEEQEEDGANGIDMHQFTESLFQSDQESTEEDGYSKEDRLGQAGPLETMDDEE
ncbi:hypothetical protein BGZ92_007975 [Podila epicladia]|nr:hypothetical protein BGZ92_007975 [Podila epicladia]